MAHRSLLAVLGASALLVGCVTRFDVDAGGPADGGADGAVVGDAAGLDTASGSDLASGTDRASPADGATASDTATGTDHSSPSDASTAADTSVHEDTNVVVPDGGMPVGSHCENAPCTTEAMCIGNSSEAYCRLKCIRGDGTCNAQTEYCIDITLPDGGPSPTGACVPALGEGQSCVNEPCAEIYVCAYSGQDAAAVACHVSCWPGATDAGCPQGQTCQGFTGQDAGACF